MSEPTKRALTWALLSFLFATFAYFAGLPIAMTVSTVVGVGALLWAVWLAFAGRKA